MGILPKFFFKDNLSTFVVQLLNNLKGIILLPLLVKSLGATIYGGYVLVAMFFSLVFGVSSLGAGFLSRRYLPSADAMEEQRVLYFPQFFFNLIVMTCVSVILAFVWKAFGHRFESIDLKIWLIPCYLITMVFYSRLTEFFRYTHRITFHNYAAGVLPVLFISTLLILVSFGETLTLTKIFFVEFVVMFGLSIILFARIFSEIGIGDIFYQKGDLARDIKLGFPIMLNFIMNFLLGGSDRYLIAGFISITAVGHYSPAYTLAALLLFLPSIFGVVLPPLLAKTHDTGKTEALRKIFSGTISAFLTIGVPFCFGALLLAKPILIFFANPEVANAAHQVVFIVGIGMIFHGLTLILSNVFVLKLETKTLFAVNGTAVFLNIFLNIIFLRILKDVHVAAVTTTISYLVVFVYCLQRLRRYGLVDFNLRYFQKIVVASVFMFCTSVVFQHYSQGISAVTLGMEIVIAIAGYFGMLIFLAGPEIRQIKKLCQNTFRDA